MKKGCFLVLFILIIVNLAWGCAKAPQYPENEAATTVDTQMETQGVVSRMQLDYATEFTVEYQEDGYALITTGGVDKYLLVPEGKEIPQDMEEDVAVLVQPVQNIYLCATASMNLFAALDAMDCITLSGTRQDGWYIEEAVQAMQEGKLVYAGKYNAPDYEMILQNGCGLAIESQMIYHTPEVKEKLESLGIPVLVDYASNEREPLGRAEWIKLYGLLTGRQQLAEQLFEEQKKAFEEVRVEEGTGKTVAFFSVTSNGSVAVRKASDYIPKLIQAAGGTYVLESMEDDGKGTTSVNMQMEEFYAVARDADYIIYNSTISGEISSIEELIDKSELLGDFKAVQNKNVWCLTKNLYQESLRMGMLTKDISIMLTKEEPRDEEFTFLFRLQ